MQARVSVRRIGAMDGRIRRSPKRLQGCSVSNFSLVKLIMFLIIPHVQNAQFLFTSVGASLVFQAENISPTCAVLERNEVAPPTWEESSRILESGRGRMD